MSTRFHQRARDRDDGCVQVLAAGGGAAIHRRRAAAGSDPRLKQRLSERDAIPLAVWDGKVRMFGDAFSLEDVGAFQLADFAKRCNVDRRLLKREAARLAKLATGHAAAQALADDYADDEERAFASRLRDFIVGQAARLTGLAGDAAKMGDEFL